MQRHKQAENLPWNQTCPSSSYRRCFEGKKMGESYLCLGQCHLVGGVCVCVFVCVTLLLLPSRGVLTEVKTTKKKASQRELCKSAWRTLVKTKISEDHHISKTYHTQLLSKARHCVLFCFLSHAYLMLMGLWQTCCLVSKTCTEQIESSTCCFGA